MPCAVEHKKKRLFLTGHFTPLTLTGATGFDTARNQQRRALYFSCRRCTKLEGVVLSCVSCSRQLGAFKTITV